MYSKINVLLLENYKMYIFRIYVPKIFNKEPGNKWIRNPIELIQIFLF